MLFVVFFIALLSGLSYAQMFLPLQQGNFWKYQYSEDYGGDEFKSTYYSFLYFADVNSNYIIQGKPYHKIVSIPSGNVMGYCRLREDGLYVYRLGDGNGNYSGEACYYKPNMAVGDTLPTPSNPFPLVMQLQQPLLVFDKQTIGKTLSGWGSTAPFYNTYSEDFGMISSIDQGIFQIQFRLLGCVIDGSVYGDTTVTTGVDKQTPDIKVFSLQQNYPNPFNPSTNIVYTLTQSGLVHLQVFDLLGNEVATLVNEIQPAGQHQAVFTAGELPSGIYICRMQSGSQTLFRKMTLLK